MPTLPPGSTALVTGASVGIGKAFAELLAARGVNVVVVARHTDLLQTLADDLAERHAVRTEVIGADLETAAGVAEVSDRLHRGVDLLINNAGYGSNGNLWDQPAAREAGMVALNCGAVVQLTHAALAAQVPSGRGGVINVSSCVGFRPMPRSATYAASKAFITAFSEAVHEELRGTGVSLSTVCPGYTRTGFAEKQGVGHQHKRIPAPMWQRAEQVAWEGLAGYLAGKPLVVTGLHNRAFVFAERVLPRSVIRAAAGRLSGTL